MPANESFTPQTLVDFVSASIAHLEYDGKDKEWTYAVKQALFKHLNSVEPNGTNVLFSDTANDNHEFLLDLVVWDRDKGEGLSLAVESEWQQDIGEIEYDFWKLLVVRADLKLMIFALNPNAHRHGEVELWQALGKCITKYKHHKRGDRYVFINFSRVPARKAWWVEIPSDDSCHELPSRIELNI